MIGTFLALGELFGTPEFSSPTRLTLVSKDIRLWQEGQRGWHLDLRATDRKSGGWFRLIHRIEEAMAQLTFMMTT